jgi:hypothetical protein
MVVAASSGFPVFKNIEPMAVHGVPQPFRPEPPGDAAIYA